MMNTRIQTLLAKFKETESTHRGAECLAGLDEIEKFAELIVRECAAHLHRRGVEGFGILEERNLMEHFGVEQ